MADMFPRPFQYNALVVSVYDGDTCTVDIDLGMGIWLRGEKLRLFRINAPEMRGVERPQGMASRDRLREWIQGREIMLETVRDKKGKYGRYLAELWLQDKNSAWININDRLVAEGLAEYREY